jgi:hypothetical protein
MRKVVARLVEYAKIDLVVAVGHLAIFWGAVSQHCARGDISDVPDSLLEEWARWRGETGVFARFVREKHSTNGIINDYDEYNGALEDRRAADRVRKAEERRRARESQSGNVKRPQDVLRKSVGSRSDVQRTIRDDTQRNREVEGALTPRQQLLTQVPHPEIWEADMDAMLSGSRGVAPVTQDQLDRAIRDYLGSGNVSKPRLRQFRRYVEGICEESEPRSPSASAPHFRTFKQRQELQQNDLARNRDPQICAIVQRYRKELGPEGEAWYQRMKADARQADRWVIPFAYDWVAQHEPHRTQASST